MTSQLAAATGREGFWVVTGGAGLLLVALAPLIRGGNRGVALVVLEGLGLLVLALLGWALVQGRLQGVWGEGWRRWALWLLVASPLWVGVVQLLPLPPALWQALTGRAPYALALQALGEADVWRPLSLTPDATWVSVLAGIPLVALFMLGLSAPRRWLHRLLVVGLAGAFLQAALGLAQLGPYPVLHAGAEFAGVIGTFANSNHLAGYLAMSLPLVVWQWQQARGGVDRAGLWVWLWPLVGFVMLLTVLAGQSRAGLVVAVVAGCGALLLCGRASQRWDWRWRLGGFAVALALALAALGTRGLQRFAGQNLDADGGLRLEVALATLRAAGDFWPAGSGWGSFAGVFLGYQPLSIGTVLVPHAHSDYVQWLLEGGAAGALCMGLAAALLVARAGQLGRQLARAGRLADDDLRAVAAGLGLLALLLHLWVDFNARIPALGMYGTFLAAVFLRPLVQSHSLERSAVRAWRS